MSRRSPVSSPSRIGLLLAGLLALDSGCEDKKPPPSREPAPPPTHQEGGAAEGTSSARLLEQAKGVFAPLPPVAQSEQNPVTDAKVDLGRILYYDPRLSKNHDISCNTCHDLAKFGVDIREQQAGTRDKVSLGHRNQPGERNSPTVYNAAIQMAQFWDGRAPTVEAQAQMPIVNPIEMGMPEPGYVIKVLESIPGYQAKFKEVFPEDSNPITLGRLGDAIGAFERKLMTPAPFDRFLQGEAAALSPEQLRGLELFMTVGCITCHTGPGVGGTMFQKLGSVRPYETKDVGRFAVTNLESDKYVFKVPTLRNVTETAPYLHDGSIATLDEMVQLMAKHQTAKGELSASETKAIVAFLGSLTGDIPTDLIAKPELPESGPQTPPPVAD